MIINFEETLGGLTAQMDGNAIQTAITDEQLFAIDNSIQTAEAKSKKMDDEAELMKRIAANTGDKFEKLIKDVNKLEAHASKFQRIVAKHKYDFAENIGRLRTTRELAARHDTESKQRAGILKQTIEQRKQMIKNIGHHTRNEEQSLMAARAKVNELKTVESNIIDLKDELEKERGSKRTKKTERSKQSKPKRRTTRK